MKAHDEIGARLDEVRNTERQARQARAARDDAIRRAKDSGASYAQVAEAAGLTRPGVQAVIRRSGATSGR